MSGKLILRIVLGVFAIVAAKLTGARGRPAAMSSS
jgi:hypothetical protein